MDLREKTRQELLCEIHNLKKTCDYLYNASCNLDDISTFNRKLSSGTEQIASSYRKIVSIRNMLADITDYQYMPVEPAFHIEKKEGMYYFRFNEPLPHRITIDKYAGRLRYEYDPNVYYSGYRSAIEQWLKENDPNLFSQKAMLYVVNHGSTQNMRDNDNIEVKTFIDAAIKGIFIRDDTPDCLSLCFDFVEDEKEYTEALLFITFPVKFHFLFIYLYRIRIADTIRFDQLCFIRLLCLFGHTFLKLFRKCIQPRNAGI